MLRLGIKGGQIIHNQILNSLIETAEAVANYNVVARIKGLSDGDSTSLENTIYFRQKRDRLVLINVYVSKTSITPISPILVKVKDMSDTDITSSFSEIDDTYDSYNFTRNGQDYILYVARRTYSVASAGQTRIKLTFDAINSSTKNFSNTKITEGMIIQFSSANTIIPTVAEGDYSSSSLINDIKTAFQNTQSYALVCFNKSTFYSRVKNQGIFNKYINTLEDFYEYGVQFNSVFDLAKEGDIYDDYIYRYYIENTITGGTLFSYARPSFTDENLNKLKIATSDTTPYILINNNSSTREWDGNVYYLDTRLSDNYIISSIADDALNSYDLYHLWRNLTARYIGMMIYPILGHSILTNEGNTGASIDAGITIFNNIDNFDFNKTFDLTSGHEVKFAIT